MRYAEIITEGREASLFHSFRELQFAAMALANNGLAATTTQRFWADGKRRKDNDPEYEDSYWMKGISATRDIRFAMKWGEVIFELDQAAISHRYKIIPFNWGYSIPGGNHHKNEREEFIVVKSTLDKYQHPDEKGGSDMMRFRSAEGSVKPLSSFLKGIYVSTLVMKERSGGQALLNHPLVKGYYIPYKGMSDGKIIPLGTDLTDYPDGLTPLGKTA